MSQDNNDRPVPLVGSIICVDCFGHKGYMVLVTSILRNADIQGHFVASNNSRFPSQKNRVPSSIDPVGNFSNWSYHIPESYSGGRLSIGWSNYE